MTEKEITISDYTYELPAEKIALQPLADRDGSRLLIYNDGSITEDNFSNIPAILPGNSLLLFNSSKVLNARLTFQKHTGGNIEIFLLEPVGRPEEIVAGNATWKCLVGGAAKWKDGLLQLSDEDESIALFAEKISRNEHDYTIRFSWLPGSIDFEKIIAQLGNVPLPPYIKRKAEKSDEERYQTVYADLSGSVAAPTAGLHFTPALINKIRARGIATSYLTLHVGAGTFMPVKAEQMQEHHMHEEKILLEVEQIKSLLVEKEIVAVGTTSVRTIETMYWLGVKLLLGKEKMTISQWEVYESPLLGTKYTRREALSALAFHLEKIGKCLEIRTSILIVPGYKFRVADYILTNFHQPQSTLLLLVAAAIGEDWRQVYNYALENQFRFLSYGDTSLLKINKV